MDEDRGSQEVPGSPAARTAEQRKRDFAAMRNIGKVVATTAPSLLNSMGNDLLAAVLDGGAARRYVALEMASLAHNDIAALHLTGLARERVCSCLHALMFG